MVDFTDRFVSFVMNQEFCCGFVEYSFYHGGLFQCNTTTAVRSNNHSAFPYIDWKNAHAPGEWILQQTRTHTNKANLFSSS
jgi:hypothetical protein